MRWTLLGPGMELDHDSWFLHRYSNICRVQPCCHSQRSCSSPRRLLADIARCRASLNYRCPDLAIARHPRRPTRTGYSVWTHARLLRRRWSALYLPVRPQFELVNRVESSTMTPPNINSSISFYSWISLFVDSTIVIRALFYV